MQSTVLIEDIHFLTSTSLDDLELLQPLNRNRVDFAKAKHASVAKRTNQLYISFDEKQSSLCYLISEVKNWVSNVLKHFKLEDGLLYYNDEYMEYPSHFRMFLPNDTGLQRHLLKVHHNLPFSMNRSCDSAYACLSRNFYWRNMAKHVRD